MAQTPSWRLRTQKSKRGLGCRAWRECKREDLCPRLAHYGRQRLDAPEKGYEPPTTEAARKEAEAEPTDASRRESRGLGTHVAWPWSAVVSRSVLRGSRAVGARDGSVRIKAGGQRGPVQCGGRFSGIADDRPDLVPACPHRARPGGGAQRSQRGDDAGGWWAAGSARVVPTALFLSPCPAPNSILSAPTACVLCLSV